MIYCTACSQEMEESCRHYHSSYKVRQKVSPVDGILLPSCKVLPPAVSGDVQSEHRLLRLNVTVQWVEWAALLPSNREVPDSRTGRPNSRLTRFVFYSVTEGKFRYRTTIAFLHIVLNSLTTVPAPLDTFLSNRRYCVVVT